MAKLGEYAGRLGTMTEDEVVLAVTKHLLGQGEKSGRMEMRGEDEEPHFECKYNGGNGLACAAGIFVENYSEAMEGLSWDTVTQDHGQDSTHKAAIEHLQYIHDQWPSDSWAETIAAEFPADTHPKTAEFLGE